LKERGKIKKEGLTPLLDAPKEKLFNKGIERGFAPFRKSFPLPFRRGEG
jgi:hypothetical protein